MRTFRKLEGALETANAAGELETKARLLRASLGRAHAIQHANPQAAVLRARAKGDDVYCLDVKLVA